MRLSKWLEINREQIVLREGGRRFYSRRLQINRPTTKSKCLSALLGFSAMAFIMYFCFIYVHSVHYADANRFASIDKQNYRKKSPYMSFVNSTFNAGVFVNPCMVDKI